MAGSASIGGIVSGFDTDTIISQLTSLQRAPSLRLSGQKTKLTEKLSAWDSLKGQMATLKQSAGEIGQAAAFGRNSAVSSDTGALTVSATADADPGAYEVTVIETARAHVVKSQGYADTTSATVGTGTVSIKVGTGTEVSVTIDSTNNTLVGMRDAINRAGAGVSAAIVNDGDAVSPYRLVVTSGKTGTDNAVTITNTLAGGTSPAFVDLQGARNASVKLGDGVGALTVSKPSNTISDLIEGVTLQAVEADADKPIHVTVSRDVASVKRSIEDFATAYTGLLYIVGDQTAYDSASGTSGILMGDSALHEISADFESLLSTPVQGVASTMSLLSQVGITVQSDGALKVDSTVLSQKLSEDIRGVSKLFATVGETTDTGVRYVSSTSATKASDAVGYAVSITQVATRARITAGAVQTGLLARDETLTVNGTSIYLGAGMTQTQVLAAINAKTDSTGITARATGADGTGAGNYLTLERSQYGSASSLTAVSSVSNGGGTPVANSAGLGTVSVTGASAAGETGTGTGAAGKDVAGSINGESATGSGQILTGGTGNARTSGLALQISGTSTGARGNAIFTRGVGGQLASLVDRFTEGKESTVQRAMTSVQEGIDTISEEMTKADERITRLQDRLRDQFNKMETMMSQLQNQGSQISQQISAWSYSASKK